MREIGGEFWDIPICNNKNDIFPSETKWFLSGRIALKYIINDINISSISLPTWCCESMIKPFTDAGIIVNFYDKLSKINSDAVLIMDYFGYTGHSAVPKDYHGIVIRDLTHSIFSMRYSDADYYFGSLRKWAGFITGGFAWGKWNKNMLIAPFNNDYVSLRIDAMRQKKDFIEGNSFDKDYLNTFKIAEQLLDGVGICGAYPQDVYNATYFDVANVKKTRRKNAEIIIDAFDSIYKLKNDECPLFVPISLNNRDNIHQFLIDNSVYCPIHWPQNDLEGHELSVVCDQRYCTNDMEKIVDLIKRGINLC